MKSVALIAVVLGLASGASAAKEAKGQLGVFFVILKSSANTQPLEVKRERLCSSDAKPVCEIVETRVY